VLSNPKSAVSAGASFRKYFKHPDVMFVSADETDERYKMFKKAIQRGRSE
jgi:hypothetical protein